MKLKLSFFTLLLMILCPLNSEAQQLSVNFSSEIETFVTTNFYKMKGKDLGVDKETRREINESLLKIKDFKTKLYNDFVYYYAIAEYQKKGSEQLMDEINHAFINSQNLDYRLDSKTNASVINENDKKNGIIRKITLGNFVNKTRVTILLDQNNKITIRFAETSI